MYYIMYEAPWDMLYGCKVRQQHDGQAGHEADVITTTTALWLSMLQQPMQCKTSSCLCQCLVCCLYKYRNLSLMVQSFMYVLLYQTKMYAMHCK